MRAPGRPSGRITPTAERRKERSHSNREWLTAPTSARTSARIADRAIGFGGFENPAAAHRAAAIAHDALTGWLARQRRIDPAPRNAGALLVRRNGAVEQLILGDVSVGRLFPHGGESGGGGGYAFELLLPPRVRASISGAQIMYLALMRHGPIRERTREVLPV